MFSGSVAGVLRGHAQVLPVALRAQAARPLPGHLPGQQPHHYRVRPLPPATQSSPLKPPPLTPPAPTSSWLTLHAVPPSSLHPRSTPSLSPDGDQVGGQERESVGSQLRRLPQILLRTRRHCDVCALRGHDALLLLYEQGIGRLALCMYALISMYVWMWMWMHVVAFWSLCVDL